MAGRASIIYRLWRFERSESIFFVARIAKNSGKNAISIVMTNRISAGVLKSWGAAPSAPPTPGVLRTQSSTAIPPPIMNMTIENNIYKARILLVFLLPITVQPQPLIPPLSPPRLNPKTHPISGQ